MNSDIPSAEEILDCYEVKCAEQHCDTCRFGPVSDTANECLVCYTIAILTKEMELGESFRKEESKPEPEPEPKLPPWCKIGQWVTASRPEHSIGYIDGVLSDKRISIAWWKHPNDGFTGPGRPTDTVTPIRFRWYTFEEAKKLIGKTMEYRTGDGEVNACLIQSVSFNPQHRNQDVLINHWFPRALISYAATIDGVPVGVPEIDNEALNGDEK